MSARPMRWLPACLLAIGVLVWANSLSGVFVFDDDTWIVSNQEIRSLADPGRILADTSRPLLKLSLALDYAAFGLEPAGYHAVNIGIHLLAALTLFGIARRTLGSRRVPERWRSAADALGFACALLWLVHPLTTQAVSYVVQRGESLASLLVLACLYACIRWLQGTRRLAWAAAAALASAAAMGTKESALTAPLLVLLWDRSFASASFRGALRDHRVLYLGLAASFSVPFVLIGPEALLAGEFVRPDLPRPGALAYAATQPAVLLHYLRLALWPSPLCFDYGWPVADSLTRILPSAAALGLLLALAAWLSWRGSPLGFPAAAFFLLLAPSSSFLPIADVAVEHRMYLPLAAVVAVVVIAAWRALQPLGNRGFTAAAGLLLVAAASLGAGTLARNRDYRSALSLWRSVTLAAPGNARGHYNLGSELAAEGRDQEAIAAYGRALAIDPRHPQANYNLGNALTRTGDNERAMQHFRRAVESDPQHAAAHMNLANALWRSGEGAQAIEPAREAVRIAPRWARAQYNLGVILESEGQVAEAITCYEIALTLEPHFGAARRRLARARKK